MAVAVEAADVMILLLEFALVCGIDIGRAEERTMARNAARYPVDLARGRAVKARRVADCRLDTGDLEFRTIQVACVMRRRGISVIARIRHSDTFSNLALSLRGLRGVEHSTSSIGRPKNVVGS